MCTPVITPLTVGSVGVVAHAAPAVPNARPSDPIVTPAAIIPLRLRMVPPLAVSQP